MRVAVTGASGLIGSALVDRIGPVRWVCGVAPGFAGLHQYDVTTVAEHTPLIPVIAVLPVTDAPQTLAMYETVSKGFLDAGFPQEHIIPAIVALESFIFGSAYDVTAPEDIFESGSMAESTTTTGMPASRASRITVISSSSPPPSV